MLKTMPKPKAILFILILFVGTGTGLAAVEETRSLGFGFHVDVIAEPTSNPSESIGHFEYLFYRKHKLSQVNKCAVAPNGNAVVYQAGPSGNIFVFERKAGRTLRLTSSFPGLVEKFIWQKGGNYIMALTDADGRRGWLKLDKKGWIEGTR